MGFALARTTAIRLTVFTIIIIFIGVLPLFGMIIVLTVMMRARTMNVRDVLAGRRNTARAARLSSKAPGQQFGQPPQE